METKYYNASNLKISVSSVQNPAAVYCIMHGVSALIFQFSIHTYIRYIRSFI